MPADKRNSSTTSGDTGTTDSPKVTNQIIPHSCQQLGSPEAFYTTKHEEWTTSKRIVNHKTKQVETRVQRQLILEDGKIIADYGPQITTKTTEDSKVEETENTQRKTGGDDPFDNPTVQGCPKVVSEKTETTQKMQETKEETIQLHDESFHDISGEEFHQRALMSTDLSPSFKESPVSLRKFPGKLVHFSSHSRKVTDKEEMKEVSELVDGELSTQTTHTHHHEEVDDDEVPEDEADATIPEISKETTRTVEYLKDKNDQTSHNNGDRNLMLEKVISEALNEQSTDEKRLKNTATTRWLEDHFGSDESDISESTRTKSGGNKIVIEMSPRKGQIYKFGPESPVTVTNGHDSRSSSASHRFHGNLNNKTDPKSFRSSPESSSSPRSPPPLSPFGRETVSTISSPFDPSSISSLSSPPKTPVKTFYLGENGTYKSEQNFYKSSTPMPFQPHNKTIYTGVNNIPYSHQVSHSVQVAGDTVKNSIIVDNDYAESRTLPRKTKFQGERSHRIMIDKNIQVSMSDEEDDNDPLFRIQMLPRISIRSSNKPISKPFSPKINQNGEASGRLPSYHSSATQYVSSPRRSLERNGTPEERRRSKSASKELQAYLRSGQHRKKHALRLSREEEDSMDSQRHITSRLIDITDPYASSSSPPDSPPFGRRMSNHPRSKSFTDIRSDSSPTHSLDNLAPLENPKENKTKSRVGKKFKKFWWKKPSRNSGDAVQKKHKS